MNRTFVNIQKTALMLAILLIVPTVFLLASCKQDQVAQNGTAADTKEMSQEVKTEESGDETATEENEATDEKAAETKGGNPVVIIKTSKGDIKLELDKENAPITVDNFIAYVNDGFYDGTIFHRVINNFMVQGGGITTDMQQKPGNPPIKNEADNGLKNDRGTIAMARTGVVDSATSQFFINTVDNDFLNHGKRDFGYAVFGNVIEGMEVVDAIQAVETGPGDVPNEQIVIESVTVVE